MILWFSEMLFLLGSTLVQEPGCVAEPGVTGQEWCNALTDLAVTAMGVSVAALMVSVPAQPWAFKPTLSIQRGGLAASLMQEDILVLCAICHRLSSFDNVSFYMEEVHGGKPVEQENRFFSFPTATEPCGVCFIWAGVCWSFSSLSSIAMFLWCIDFICGNAIYYCHQLSRKKKRIVLCEAP